MNTHDSKRTRGVVVTHSVRICQANNVVIEANAPETQQYNTIRTAVVTCARKLTIMKPRLHDTTCCQSGCRTGCQTGFTKGCVVYTNIQPVVKPV